LNAIGYIYFKAPDFLETNTIELRKYGLIKKNMGQAKKYFDMAAKKGNLNALYNLGCYHLSGHKDVTFSFSEAYDYFKQAAEKGHTFSVYNVAIMHYLGIGTFESC